jgi:hypothetical protein
VAVARVEGGMEGGRQVDSVLLVGGLSVVRSWVVSGLTDLWFILVALAGPAGQQQGQFLTSNRRSGYKGRQQ